MTGAHRVSWNRFQSIKATQSSISQLRAQDTPSTRPPVSRYSSRFARVKLTVVRLLKGRFSGAKAKASTGTRLLNDKALVRENERGGPDGSIRAKYKNRLGTTALFTLVTTLLSM